MAQIKPGNYCPLIKKDCIGLKCSWYTQVRGMNPQTGEPVDEWGCAITWLPMLTIENSQQQRSTGAAVESFRNEMVYFEPKSMFKVNLSKDDNRVIFTNYNNQDKYVAEYDKIKDKLLMAENYTI